MRLYRWQVSARKHEKRQGELRILRYIAIRCVIVIMFCLSSLPVGAATEEPVATDVTLSQSGQIARIEVALTGVAGFRLFTVDDPQRVIIDFPDLQWGFTQSDLSSRMIKGLRFGRSRRGAARLVVDLRGPARVGAAYTDADAGRFVIEMAPASAAEFSANAGWPPDERQIPVPTPPVDDDVVTVVIDPGHGGIDPGATVGQITEKDLVFSYARAIAEVLNARPGFRAHLTREGDQFLGLRERVAITRRLGGDVFISLHADSLEAGDASGTSIFTLSAAASSREAAALSRSSNRADVIAGVEFDAEEADVTRVLVDIARRRTAVQSDRLAKILVDALAAETVVLRGRAHQAAGFRVLKAPDVPSILVELGFLSSERDQARLTSASGQAAIVRALTDGIIKWAEREDDPRYAPARP